MNELNQHSRMDINVDTRIEYVAPVCRIREADMQYMYLQTISNWHEDPIEWD